MEDGLLSLKWNNHKSTFFHILSGLRKKETYTDATLACEGKFFPVHRLVMSTCSDYFGEVFERTTCKSPVVILKDIRYHDLEALLDYMYLGEVDVKQSELAGLIKAAECLRIKGLAVPDEDPTHAPVNKKGATHVPESRNRGAYSPAAKRARRASGGSDGGLGDSYTSSNSHHRTSGMGASKAVGRRSLSPTASPSRAYSSSSNVTSTSVPSQATSNSDTLHNQIPPRLMIPPPPPPNVGDTLHSSEGSGDPNRDFDDDHSVVPVEMIKVEVEEEGGTNSNPLRGSEGSGVALGDGPTGEGDTPLRGRRNVKENLSNSFAEFGSSNHGGGEVEKEEEHDQIEAYNGSDQLAGPSGVQGTPQMMNWGEEDGNFPHNLFGGEDSSQQQVCIAIMEPELLAVRMFQGPKSELSNNPSITQLRVDGNQIIPVEQAAVIPSSLATVGSTPPVSAADPSKKAEAHYFIYQQTVEQLQKTPTKVLPPQLVQQPVVDQGQTSSLTGSSSVTVSTLSTTPLSHLPTQVVPLPYLSQPQTQPQLQAQISRQVATKKTYRTRAKKDPSKQSPKLGNVPKPVKKRRNQQRQPRTSHKTRSQKSSPTNEMKTSSILEMQLKHHRQPSVSGDEGIQIHPVTIAGSDGGTVSVTIPSKSFSSASAVHVESLPQTETCKTNDYPKIHSMQNLQDYPPTLPSSSVDQMPPTFQSFTGENTHQAEPPLHESTNTASPQDLSSKHQRFHFCTLCNYHSRSKVDLNKHIRVHTKEKPYKCQMCKYETGDKSNFKRHVSSVHKTREAEAVIVCDSPQHILPHEPSPAQPPLSPSTVGATSTYSVVEGGASESSVQSQPLSIHAIEVVTIPYSEANLTSTTTAPDRTT